MTKLFMKVSCLLFIEICIQNINFVEIMNTYFTNPHFRMISNEMYLYYVK